MTDAIERTHIGVALVHGIGEQKRYEHLDAQVRAIVEALSARPGTRVTTEIESVKGNAFHALTDAWDGNCPVRVFVDEDYPPRKTLIEFHEVWWADVNEQYSLFKQIRFWSWALAIWFYPGKAASALPQADLVQVPKMTWLKEAWIRLRLFGVGVVSVVAAASIGVVLFFAERVFKLRAPDFAKTFLNYVAGVKLYNQPHRLGPGFPPRPDDLLDALGDPPRISVRRRMVRVLMGMAQRNYERWYVFGHSLGSVVAFNGLMSQAQVWPGYFDEHTWTEARKPPDPLVGPASPHWNPRATRTLPARPVWAPARVIAYRSRIFHNFQGLLTFGCPLEKFAAVWPARVFLSHQPAFRAGTEWFNVFDPTDPVSGVMTMASFGGAAPHGCPAPQNRGFAAGPWLLLSHLKYLRSTKRRDGLSDAVAEWLLSGSSARMGVGRDWFAVDSGRAWRRSLWAWAQWIIAFIVLALAGAAVLSWLGHTFGCSAHKVLEFLHLRAFIPGLCPSPGGHGGAT